MKRTSLTVMALCATLLWVGAAHAGKVVVPASGGLPTCQASLNLSNSNLLTCDGNLVTAQLCEQCAQSILNGSKTCVTQGFVGGTLQCGANCMFDTSGCFATRFTDDGDGTVSDHKTGLMWEQTTGTLGGTNTGKINDVNNSYTWSTGDNLADGTAFTSFVATLNNGASVDGGATTAITGCFANHCDWRLPSIVELQGIIDPSATGCGSGNPCIDPTFGPTQSSFYWSATTDAGDPFTAWGVTFYTGDVLGGLKADGSYVRAVRSGL